MTRPGTVQPQSDHWRIAHRLDDHHPGRRPPSHPVIPRPDADADLPRFMRRLTLPHTQRRHAHRHSAGSGHLDQGRFKSFPIQDDDHLPVACRYVPRPDDWLARVNAPMTPAEEQDLGRCIRRGQPFGGPDWQAEAIARLGLESTTRHPGRPRKPADRP